MVSRKCRTVARRGRAWWNPCAASATRRASLRESEVSIGAYLLYDFPSCHFEARFGSPNARYHFLVIRRFYVHNFRCLENFELPVSGQPAVLLIGKNGSGKTTVGLALEILQRIARGTNRVGDLVKPKHLT